MPPASCPCGLAESYAACCGRFHDGGLAAPTAELLMRSRFSAFAVGDTAYLLRTWHPDTRPRKLALDPGQEWTRLEILARTGGGLLHNEGTVEFRAHYRHRGRDAFMEENSRFRREAGQWVYLDAEA
ncbi:MAG: motif domain protein [Actinomycetota bacterium]|nr:motif domain protein [Actinomycetota bacterium]